MNEIKQPLCDDRFLLAIPHELNIAVTKAASARLMRRNVFIRDVLLNAVQNSGVEVERIAE